MAAQRDILQKMTEDYSAFTKAGKKVADYVFEHKQEAQYMSITSLAEECNVADATITRFCKLLGYDGYSEFKLALAMASGSSVLPDEGTIMEGKIEPSDSIPDMAKKLYGRNVSAISESLTLLDENAIRRAVRYFSGAQRVFCFGQGGSMVMAMDAWARFATAAPQFMCVEDSHMQAMTASLCTHTDVILFVSYSGATKDMLDVLRPAKARGAKIVLITHFSKSPAAAFADVILLCGSKEGPLQSGSIAAKMGILFLVDVLYYEFCRQNPEFTAKNREITAEAISGKLL